MEYRRYEDLEEDLKEEQQIKDNAVAVASEALSKEGFKETKELNGVSFTMTHDNDVTVYHCQFYIDTEAETYSSYITSDTDGDKTTTFQQKGPVVDAPTAVDKFIQFLHGI